MADDPIVQMASDPDFAKMDIGEQRKALAAHDPDFAKVGDDDITSFVSAHQAKSPEAQSVAAAPDPVAQSRAALASKVQPNNLMNVLTGKPLTAMQPGMSSPAQTPENRDAMSLGAAVGAPVGGIISGGVRAIPVIARGLVGATAGSALGGYGGKEVGGLVGHPEAGEKIGATIGGLAGGITAGRGGSVPTKSTFLNKILGIEDAPSYVPASKSPGPYRGPSSVPKLALPEPELGSPDNPGFMSKLPTGRNSMPKQLPWNQGTTGSAKQPFEPLVFGSEEEAAQHDVRMQNLKRQASSAGTYHAAQGAAGKRTNLQQRIQKKDDF